MPREDHCRVISPHDHPLKALNHGAVVTTREIRSADGAGEENVTAEHDRGIVGLSRTREDNRPLGVTGGMRHDEADASKVQDGPVSEQADIVRLGELEFALRHREQVLTRCDNARAGGVSKPVSVITMDVGGDSIAMGHRRHGPHMVDMAVGKENGRGLQPMLANGVLNSPDRILARIDDEAWLTRTARNDVAIRRP